MKAWLVVQLVACDDDESPILMGGERLPLILSTREVGPITEYVSGEGLVYLACVHLDVIGDAWRGDPALARGINESPDLKRRMAEEAAR